VIALAADLTSPQLDQVVGCVDDSAGIDVDRPETAELLLQSINRRSACRRILAEEVCLPSFTDRAQTSGNCGSGGFPHCHMHTLQLVRGTAIPTEVNLIARGEATLGIAPPVRELVHDVILETNDAETVY
jgi:hypothetical protein